MNDITGNSQERMGQLQRTLPCLLPCFLLPVQDPRGAGEGGGGGGDVIRRPHPFPHGWASLEPRINPALAMAGLILEF